MCGALCEGMSGFFCAPWAAGVDDIFELLWLRAVGVMVGLLCRGV